jgi:hypothetical protein
MQRDVTTSPEVPLFGFICTAAWVLCYCVVPKYVGVVIICKYVKKHITVIVNFAILCFSTLVYLFILTHASLTVCSSPCLYSSAIILCM